MSNSYPVQVINTSQKSARISFSDEFEDVKDELKMTPMVFCFLGDEVVLSYDKTKEWNAQCGHRDDGESVEACLKREAFEEAGIDITINSEFGRMKYETAFNLVREYPPVTYIPVYIAKVNKIGNLPNGSEVKEVIIADHEEAKTLLGSRDDDKLLLSIYEKCRERYFLSEGR